MNCLIGLRSHAQGVIMSSESSRSVPLLPDVNYEEAKVPAYTLPDPLVLHDGTRVPNGQVWLDRRCPEIAQLFAEHMYGKAPDPPEGIFHVQTF